MEPGTIQHFSYAMLFDPSAAQAAAERASQWDLPRRVCRPLDRYAGRKINSDLAAYDEAIDRAPVPEEEMLAAPTDSDRQESCPLANEREAEEDDDSGY